MKIYTHIQLFYFYLYIKINGMVNIYDHWLVSYSSSI